jgi:chromosome segregation protein
MRLRHIDLQGYKTFAGRTEFVFDGGITAIVGPNGSGKSNIADAIRWVLGEQSYRALRGKRTEDMIFSGSSQRARLGMASAALVLDNADGWLPIDFGEVTITRRAYRSGENEYLLNGQRVRLRDITELLAKSGLAQRTYTVIGQGLVDAVLSLRPDDRRALFEEAAGIVLYQSKRADALSRLEETRSNLLRVNDIVNEIAPRLRRLEREAERAEHYALLSRQLEGLLRTWYGFRWHQGQLDLRRARDSVVRREAVVARQREALAALENQMAGLRVEQSELRERLGGWHRESGDLHRQMEGVQRDLAVWQERARLLARQGDEIQAELTELAVQGQVAAGRVAAAEQEVVASEAASQAKEGLAAQAQTDLDALETQRQSMSQQMTLVQARAFDLATQTADRRNRLDQLQERQSALARSRADHQVVLADQQARVADVRSQIQGLVAEQTRLQAEGEALRGEAVGLEASLAKAQSSQAELGSQVAEFQRIAERLQARRDLLARLREEGEGLHSGVRAVLQAAGGQRREASAARSSSSKTLSGILGAVAQLLHVPAQYEAAVEVALGGHLQDLVVESWPDAEAAIAFLQEGKRGRATFLPLDTVRPGSRLELPQGKGIVGVAADLVQAEGHLGPVVEMLLGRTVVTNDLPTARRVFDRLRGGFQIVTLAGEILHSSGSVTGGQGREQGRGQVLTREREWRELPLQIEAARAEGQKLEAALAEAQSVEQQLRDQVTTLAARRREKEGAAAEIQAQLQNLEREADLAAQQIALRQSQVTQLDEEAAGLDALESSLQADMARLVAEQAQVEGQVTALQAELDGLRGERLYQRLSEARTAAAVARGAWEHRCAALEGLRERHGQLQAQIEAKRRRLSELDREQAALAGQMHGVSSRETVIQGWLGALVQKIEPAEAQVAQLEVQREGLEKEESTLRSRAREAESRHAQALLAQSRHEDRLERLRRQIMEDFGLVEMESVEGLPEQPPLPLGEMVSTLPVVEALPEGMEEEIHQIKAQLRRMGAVNLDAPDEYAEVLDRYSFLTTQATDLEEAARSLREVIAELDLIMRREFDATFRAVATRFRENFTQLFGGGTARLLLTDPDDLGQTGIEIVAQPPGKRQQTLALLSGGERSLTAVALIFSILEVNPPPFCILDEVDAMLDEANVRRFREALEVLSQKTQFIVITHNRGTIQAASTIYGVSMGEDSTSQVISLRLDGDRIAAPDGTSVDIKAG